MRGRVTVQLDVDVPMTSSDQTADGSDSIHNYGEELTAVLKGRACVDNATLLSAESD